MASVNFERNLLQFKPCLYFFFLRVPFLSFDGSYKNDLENKKAKNKKIRGSTEGLFELERPTVEQGNQFPTKGFTKKNDARRKSGERIEEV